MDVYLVLVDESLRSSLLALGHQLRASGLSVDYALTETAVGKQFKAASQRDSKVAVVLGPDEWKQGQVKLKDLNTREERAVGIESLAAELLKLIKK